jgi:hypothetical protein
MTYEQLDTIADAVNPALLVLSILIPLLTRSEYRGGKIRFFLSSFLSLAAMFAIGWVDSTMGIWPAKGLDYSTHTGLATVYVIGISLWKRALIVPCAVVFLSYVALMIYQRYHTLADIATTAIVIVPIALTIHRWTPILKRSAQPTGESKAS